MKKFALFIGAVAAVALLGAGCAQEPSATPINSVTNTPSSTPVTPPAVTTGSLKERPALTALAQPIDDSAWVTTAMRSGVALKTPSKTGLTPTSWTYSLLDSTDSHLKGNCYVTDATVYEETASWSDFTNACQTTTELNAGPSERTDYFVFQTTSTDKKGKQTIQNQMFTFTKSYKAGFDMNAYGATVEHIIKSIVAPTK